MAASGYKVAHNNGSANPIGAVDIIELDSTASANDENNTGNCTNDYCVSEEEYMDMIASYIWPNPFEWGLISMYMIVFIVGLVGNFLVCLAVWRNHHMRTVTNYFIVNLAIADFLVILICLPPTVLGDVTETWFMGKVMCKIVKYLQVRHNVPEIYLFYFVIQGDVIVVCRMISFKCGS